MFHVHFDLHRRTATHAHVVHLVILVPLVPFLLLHSQFTDSPTCLPFYSFHYANNRDEQVIIDCDETKMSSKKTKKLR
jgi:hypothetical protein